MAVESKRSERRDVQEVSAVTIEDNRSHGTNKARPNAP